MMYDVIVIGCGPAGISAAINLKLSGINVAIIEKNAPGGAMNMITCIKNYPGSKNIKGAILSLNMYNQLLDLDIPYIYGEVTSINDGITKQVVTDRGTYEATYIIIATGRKYPLLGLQNEKQYMDYGINYSEVCDIDTYDNKEIIIVGSTNRTIDLSIRLSKKAFSITIINDKKDLEIDDYHKELLDSCTNIHYLGNSKITRLIGNETLEEVEISNIAYNEKYTKKLDYLFVAKDCTPLTDFIKNTAISMEDGYLQVFNNKTNIKNIYAIGDVTQKDYYSITSAINDGMQSAQDIIKRMSINY